MPPFQIKQPVGLAAKLAASKSASTIAEGQELQAPVPKAQPITYLAVNDPAVTDKIGIVFDDSSSMNGTKIQEARDGVVEFLRSCVPNQIAVALYPMCSTTKYPLDTNLPHLATKTLDIRATGSTPLVRIALQMLNENTTITRGVIFSDGLPDSYYTGALVTLCKERKVSLDTCYIGPTLDLAIGFMRRLAEETGGTFIHLKPGVSIRTALKYLAPVYRAMLSDKSFVDKLQEGRI